MVPGGLVFFGVPENPAGVRKSTSGRAPKPARGRRPPRGTQAALPHAPSDEPLEREMTMMTKMTSLWWMVGTAALVLGCGGGGGAGPSTAQERLGVTVDPVITAATGALEFLDTSALLDGADRALGATNGAFATLPFAL